MGFWGSVGSFVSSAFSTVSSALSSFSSIGSLITKALTVVFPPLKVIETIITVVKVVAAVCEALGIIDKKEKEDPEEFGDKILQAEKQDITPDKFDSREEYLKRVREIQLDKDLSMKTSKTEKMGASLAYMVTGIQDKLNVEFKDISFLAKIGLKADFFTEKRVLEYVKEFASIGISLNNISEYFDCKLKGDDLNKVEKTIISAEKIISPEKQNKEIYKMLDLEKK